MTFTSRKIGGSVSEGPSAILKKSNVVGVNERSGVRDIGGSEII